MIEHDPIDTGLWRAGCSATGTSGSEGGPRKRTDSKDRQRASARPYDYVRSTEGPIGPYIDALREIAERVGLVEKSHKLTGEMVHFICVAPAENDAEIRIKIEINIAETQAVLGRQTRPLEVRSRWWHGAGEVSTFALEELMATKLRALYQRRKGRDLFDLWHVLTAIHVDDEQIVHTMERYMDHRAFGFPELRVNLRVNLRDKLTHPDFRNDLNTLITDHPAGYELLAAADLLMERLGPHLKNAPGAAEITGGAWRQ